MIRFACPSCQTVYAADDKHAGQRTTCKKCAEKFLIPIAADGERPYEVETTSAPAAPVPEPAQSVEVPPAPEPPPLPPAVPVELAPCPTCGAKMSVRPEDVGYDLQCPFCQTTFRGEAATASEPAPPVPEPEAAGVEIAPCPKCKAELTVAPSDVGGEVECPFCKTVYAAEKPKPKPNTRLARPSARPAAPPPPLPTKQTYDENEDDTTPIKVKFEKEAPNEGEDEDDDDDNPRRKKRRKRGNDPYDPYDPIDERAKEESNGIVCLLVGLACFFCCFIFAFWSVPFCKETIDKVNSGQMDESAKPLATAGMILSYLSVVVALMQAAFFCLGALR